MPMFHVNLQCLDLTVNPTDDTPAGRAASGSTSAAESPAVSGAPRTQPLDPSQPQPVPTLAEIDRRMTALDARLEAVAALQYRSRSIHPDEECYQLDGSTFISTDAFDTIAGADRSRYMAWKNGCIDDLAAEHWNEPQVMEYLASRSIDEGEGGECCYTDAQPIDYAQSCTYQMSDMLRRRSRDDESGGHDVDVAGDDSCHADCRADSVDNAAHSAPDWSAEAAAEDGLTHALYEHPDVDVVADETGRAVVISASHPERAATVDYRGGTWTVQPFDHDRPCSETATFSWRDVPQCRPDGGSETEQGRRFNAAFAAFAHAIEWVDGR
ncbi:hypothetical protein [Bifidobacterium leontopitheci]|uniref:Uncharacterized protein n=1 Tax=Bifidobacterium leontopitheci TaxID=2650774 RepID=A0A6I1GT90_9BIFI|nr:hypothetical protein [Bifidobacterium leontopitheci]KAB7789681.1 hypothetical protein F7D09_1815 [Bifidobacterium leontopitheci]